MVCCEAMTLPCLKCSHPDLTDEEICDRYLREHNDPDCARYSRPDKLDVPETGFGREFASPPLVIGIGIALLFLSALACWWVLNSPGRDAHVRPDRLRGPEAAQEQPRSATRSTDKEYPRKRRSVATTI